MSSASQPTDPVPSDRRAIFDEFVFNHLPTHLLYVNTAGESQESIEIELISGGRIRSLFEPELRRLFDQDKKRKMSKKDILSRLKKEIRFAIFSHRWFQEGEPSFHDFNPVRPFTRGYHKLVSFCQKAAVEYKCRLAWSDTCCINKTSSAELDEAIRSMFRWYRSAHVCIVHLSDATHMSYEALKDDVWFTRGWTLQELLAPKQIRFYGGDWEALTNMRNDKDDDACMACISRITNIPVDDLRRFEPGTKHIRQRMSWASRRTTTRVEDIAYSLIGVFDVNLPIAYGEGTWAFHRLMEVIILRCDEWGIFAWAGLRSTHHNRTTAVAQSPACFHLIPDDTVKRFPDESKWVHGDTSFALSRQGLQLCVMVVIGDMRSMVNAVGEEEYTFTDKPSYAGATFGSVDVRASDGITIEGNEWAVGILNYRLVEPEGEYGKIEGSKSYVCLLLRRSEGTWERVLTDNILIINTLFEGESREEVLRLQL